MPDALITRDGPVGAPLDYTIPASSELEPISVSATFTDPSNAGPYIPVLEVITPSGNVIGPFPLSQSIAAGASARVSWFPGIAGNDDAPGIWYVVQPVAPAAAPALSTAGASFLNGWANAALPDGTYSPLRYRLDPATNMIRIVGAISGGALGAAAFVLPAAFRPATDVVMVIASADGSVALACSVSASTGAVVPLAGASTSSTPAGTAGGDLAGSYPAPTVVAVEETSGPTRLAVAAVTDGQYLRRSGATITSGTPSGTSPLTTKGDLYGYDVAGDRIPVGSDGQVLTADSTQALGVKWAGASTGALVQLYASTLGASAVSFDITPISGAYSVLQLYALLRDDAADAFVGSALIRFNNDSGANYAYQFMRGFGGSVGAGSNDAATSGIGLMETDASVTANYFGGGRMAIPFYANTTTFKTAFTEGGALGSGANDDVRPTAFMWKSTAAISRITILPSAGTHFVAGSAVVLYGLT